jgi:uncharacterized membrane protein
VSQADGAALAAHRAPSDGFDLTDAGPELDPPSRADDTVARASWMIGGAWGRYAGRGRWWTPLRVLLAFTAITMLLAFAEKSPCANGDWTGNKQYTHACYSDIVPLWSAEGLDRGAVPYRDTAVEYPVLTGGFIWLAAGIEHGLHGVFSSLSDVELFGLVNAVLLAACALLTVAGTAGAAGRRPYDAALVALSPLLVFHAFSNWDLLAMALASCGLWAWARGRPVAAGALIGLGTAAKLYPVFLLVPLLILAIRTRRMREAAWAIGSAAAAWAAVNLPVAVVFNHGWWEFYKFSEQRPAEASTFWYIGHYLATVGFMGDGTAYAYQPPGIAVALALVVALGAVVWLGLRAPVRPRIGQLAFLAVLAFLITTKVWSPQYSIWLIPLVALARPRWRITLVWQFAEIAVWIATLWELLGGVDSSRGLDYGWLMVILLVRDGLLLGIAGLVIREMWRPDLDVVRASGLDDPAGGVFDGAPDVWRILPRQRRAVLVTADGPDEVLLADDPADDRTDDPSR